MKKRIAFAVFLLSLVAFFTSCDSLFGKFADIDVSGKIHYGTGTYGQVSYIEFTVTGGSGPYKCYYARTASNDHDYAYKNSSYIGEAEEGESYTYNGVDGYVSTGWYYHIFAIDSNGAEGHAVWHP